ncbi:METTL9 isoform 11 [Pan troglodytes]|uniref:Methyltransferase 9, His-X-His N1(pi)-histidine n=3 Tax=Hominidae TaxID=9604 RepID=H3BRP5_HUMAN|nr:methyltransferase like 9 [Homo sapiens]KAI4054050.1 methyltransferase like 9 [Homo sapiens]PNI11491.1 METTL9 isoform 11 [Pan troglodytes]PNJ05491.1 METTL9 isoform 6 [Pongo abelii]
MRLLAGWLCLSLASVWLARRMWTLRSPLTRSLGMCATERNYANHSRLSLFRVTLIKEHRSS